MTDITLLLTTSLLGLLVCSLSGPGASLLVDPGYDLLMLGCYLQRLVKLRSQHFSQQSALRYTGLRKGLVIWETTAGLWAAVLLKLAYTGLDRVLSGRERE